MPALPPPTLIVRNIGELLTMAPESVPDATGPLGIVPDAALVARGEQILFVGPAARLAEVQFAASDVPPQEIDLGGRVVTPGLIDSHTHLVFAGDRAGEFQQRHAGVSYGAIAAAGGGIVATMRATRAASFAELVALGRTRLRSMRTHGTTTVETKTGYGLDRETEERLLAVAARLGRERGLPRVISTFLGAHVVPPEYRADRAAYVAAIQHDWLPRFAGRADFCDVFCEGNAFTAAESRAILSTAKGLGYRLKLHADQMSACGGAALAAEWGATSADHLDHASDADLDRLAAAGVVAVLLPGCSFTLNAPYPDARRMVAHGVPIALATDFNPGTCYCENLQMMVALAIAHMGLTLPEALLAVTRNAARALSLSDAGTLVAGQRCDLALWGIRSHHEIGYHFGVNLVEQTIIGGHVATA
ncbi:MAG: imidazolonepropionase [Ktedonobacterales bacterium]|nr:imidazolonepropionase [Ktedonobacterales bacterium]